MQVEDVTERRATAEELTRRARTEDSLTGLANRAHFLERLDEAIAGCAESDRRLAPLFLDLDNFKDVNDGLGHAAGDRLLRIAAERLRAAVRPDDAVARLGGDEFTVLCDDIAERDAMALARRIADALSRPFELDGRELFVTASIGVVVSDGSSSATNLLREADAAMYRAKDGGRARIERFDAVTAESAAEHLRTSGALHRALDNDELDVHYQPMVDLETGRVAGFEALVRWHDPDRGLVPPVEFIGLAEATGLVVPVGRYVLRAVCRQLARWRADGDDLSVSVNLSTRQLGDRALPADIAHVLADTGVPAHALWLEITETSLMRDPDAAAEAVRALRSLGVRIAVDDFGTGYSSLAHLRRFPVEALKIDQSFVAGLGRQPEDTAIVAAVVSLAHALGVHVVAEGVEDDEQLATLRTLGCDAAQGFLLGEPRPAEEWGPRPAAARWGALAAD